jgi:hypothetical protein
MRLANDCAIDFGDLRADRGVDVADDDGRDRPAAPDTPSGAGSWRRRRPRQPRGGRRPGGARDEP